MRAGDPGLQRPSDSAQGLDLEGLPWSQGQSSEAFPASQAISSAVPGDPST